MEQHLIEFIPAPTNHLLDLGSLFQTDQSDHQISLNYHTSGIYGHQQGLKFTVIEPQALIIAIGCYHLTVNPVLPTGIHPGLHEDTSSISH